MSDYLPSTPDLSEHYCPACEPDRDPFQGITVERWCYQHRPDDSGPDDALTGPTSNLSGTSEVEGGDCRAVAKLLRKRRKKTWAS